MQSVKAKIFIKLCLVFIVRYNRDRLGCMMMQPEARNMDVELYRNLQRRIKNICILCFKCFTGKNKYLVLITQCSQIVHETGLPGFYNLCQTALGIRN